MTETRTVELTFEKAREWYNKGGDLKEVALQAFTEKELRAKNLYGDIMLVNGMRCYVIGIDEYGNPNAWLSERLKKFTYTNTYTSNDTLSKEEALDMKFSGGWHIPSFDEMKELKEGILATAERYPQDVDYVMWNTSEYDTICWWGINGKGEGTRLRHVHAILKK